MGSKNTNDEKHNFENSESINDENAISKILKTQMMKKSIPKSNTYKKTKWYKYHIYRVERLCKRYSKKTLHKYTIRFYLHMMKSKYQNYRANTAL